MMGNKRVHSARAPAGKDARAPPSSASASLSGPGSGKPYAALASAGKSPAFDDDDDGDGDDDERGGDEGSPSPTAAAAAAASSIPYVKRHDAERALPRYVAVAARPPDDGVAIDELDALQPELETLLCAAAMRARLLRAEMEAIDRRDRSQSHSWRAAASLQRSFGKRRALDDDSRSTSLKEVATVLQQPPKFKPYSPQIASNAAPSSTPSAFNESLLNESSVKLEIPALLLPKNNVPQKFWNSTEPYCAPITPEYMKFVESLLNTSNNVPPPPIPPLGRHYSEAWADEHENNNAKHSSNSRSNSTTPVKKSSSNSDGHVTGPLSQRLVCALLESGGVKMDFPKSRHSHKSASHAASYRNSLALERCLRKELVEQGILDQEDLPPLTNAADDEILGDIKKCLNELTALRKTNVRHLRNMASLCKQEMARNELKKKLEQVDAEVTEMFRKNQMAKAKNRPLTKKEKEDAWRLINEQKRLNGELDALPRTGPNA